MRRVLGVYCVLFGICYRELSLANPNPCLAAWLPGCLVALVPWCLVRRLFLCSARKEVERKTEGSTGELRARFPSAKIQFQSSLNAIKAHFYTFALFLHLFIFSQKIQGTKSHSIILSICPLSSSFTPSLLLAQPHPSRAREPLIAS